MTFVILQHINISIKIFAHLHDSINFIMVKQIHKTRAKLNNLIIDGITEIKLIVYVLSDYPIDVKFITSLTSMSDLIVRFEDTLRYKHEIALEIIRL